MLRASRRQWLQAASLGLLGSSASGWFPAFADSIANDPKRRRHCILLWMTGGPTQTDTFDMKPGHANGGEFKEVATAVPGFRFSEHLPNLAKHADRLAVVRSLSTKEGDHARGTHLVRTGHSPMGGVAYPSIACALAKELTPDSAVLPNYVTVAPPRDINPAAFEPGFLGARYAPAIVGGGAAYSPDAGSKDSKSPINLKMEDLELPQNVNADEAARRLALWSTLEKKFLDG